MYYKLQRFVTISLILFTCCVQVHGQTIRQMDERMAWYMDRLNYWYSHADQTMGGADSLENNNDLFIDYLEKTVIQHDSSVFAPFPQAVKNGLNASYSTDSILRIYAWDRKDDPDKEHMENIAAYMTYYNIRYTDLDSLEKKGTPGYFYDSIIPVRTGEGIAYVSFYHRDKPLHIEGVKVFGIVKHKITKLPLFKDKTGSYSELTYDYSPATGEDTGKGKLLLHFNDKHDKLYIPVISDDIFAGKFVVYAFDGYKFVLEKNTR